MKVLFVSSEAVPFAKSGGLADVSGTLPLSLAEKGVDVRLVMPLYGCVAKEYRDKMKFVKAIMIPVSWRMQYCGIFELEYKNIKVYFIDNEFYFLSHQLYGYIHEDMEKFAFFSSAALSILPDIDFRPDIIHVNDWQSAAIPVLLNAHFQNNDFYRGIKTVITIHNLKFQGVWDRRATSDVFGLDDSYFTSDKLEYHGDINVLKGGIVYSDAVTTVSDTYAQEIKTPMYGEGLDGLLRAKSASLTGILNGISYDEYNPATDENIYKKYTLRGFKGGKAANKAALQKDLGLKEDPDCLMIGIVSRLTEQKGLDLVSQVIAELSKWNIQLVVLGTGEAHYENMFRWYQKTYPEKFAAKTCFDNNLAHKIYAACDAFLMPSRFEPCGLSQIISLKYGTLPIVRETGGLKDTVTAYNEYTGEGCGFSFAPYDSRDLLEVLRYAAKTFSDKKAWEGLVKNAMKADFSWDKSASKYIDLYRGLLGQEV